MTLLLDALLRTTLEPGCAGRWHRLMATWAETADAAARQAVLDKINTLPTSDPRADILRLTFLDGATGEPLYEDSAAALVLAVEPADPDRLAATLAFRWLSALQEIDRREQFSAALNGGRAAELVSNLLQHATRQLPRNLQPRVPNEIRRVAVVVPHMANRFHTPGMMAIEQCAVLARAGQQVKLFSAQELTPLDAAQFRGDGRTLVLPKLSPKELAGVLPEGVGLMVADERFSLPGRWRNLMPALAEFDPDVVLLVGLYSPLASALYSVRPVVGISVNTVVPLAPLDVWLAGPGQTDNKAWGEAFPAPEIVRHPYRVSRLRSVRKLQREQLGLNPNGVIWLSAGFRLEHEIRGEWARRMLESMARYPEVSWLLVGGTGRLPQSLQRAAPRRILALPTRGDMADILEISDIYVNPPRMGGGFSVAEAMAAGLPVASFSGSDGGDKVGELAVKTIDAYIERLAALTERPQLRAEAGKALRQRFDEQFDVAASAPALLAAFRKAADHAAVRLRKSA